MACEIIDNIYASSPDWNSPLLSSGVLPELEKSDYTAKCDTLGGVPNVVGMGLRDAVYLLESQGYKVETKGRGRIVEQSPSPGSPVDIDTNCVTLSLAEKL